MSYPTLTVTDGVFVLGPHLEPFWPGNFAPLSRRFASVLASAKDRLDTSAVANAERLLGMIDMSRREFAAIPDEDKPGWLVNMAVVKLTQGHGDLLVYSPTPLDSAGEVARALETLGTVRIVVIPHGGHVSGLASFKRAFPEALFLCPRAGSFLGFDLAKTAPEVRFDLVVEGAGSLAVHPKVRHLMTGQFEIEVSDDGAIFELVLFHKPTQTVLTADTLYKSHASAKGVGSADHSFLVPQWFADAYETLNISPARTRYLPENREFLAKHPKFNQAGYKQSLRRILSWDAKWLLSSHIDPMPGAAAKEALKESWGWLLDGET